MNDATTKQQLLCSLKCQLEQLLFIKTGLVNGQTEQILLDNNSLILNRTKRETEKIRTQIISINERLQDLVRKTLNMRISVIEFESYTYMINYLTEKMRRLKFLFDFFSMQLKRLRENKPIILRTDAFILAQKQELLLTLN